MRFAIILRCNIGNQEGATECYIDRREEKPNNHSMNRERNRRIKNLTQDILSHCSFTFETLFSSFSLFLIHMCPGLLNLDNAVCSYKYFSLMTLAEYVFFQKGTNGRKTYI